MQLSKVSEYRGQLAAFHRKVLQDHDPLRVSGRDGDVVVMAAEDYENMLETIYILKDEVTMASLLETRKQVSNGKFQGSGINEAFQDLVESQD